MHTCAFLRWARIVCLYLLLSLSLLVDRALAIPSWEEGTADPKNIQLTLYTFGPGPAPEGWWGHIALEIRDTKTNQALLYNWGMFSFTENLIRDFLSGRLWFWVERTQVDQTLAQYRREGRYIVAQTLQLSPERRTRLVAAVAENMLPENRNYLYDYFRDNCATRIRDLLDAVLDGQLQAETQQQPSPSTWRDFVHRYMTTHLSGRLLYNFLLGRSVDGSISRWDEMFLPLELSKGIENFEYMESDGLSVRLVSESQELQLGTISLPPEIPSSLMPWNLIAGLSLGLLSFVVFLPLPQTWRKRTLGVLLATYGLVLGIFGTFLFFLVVATGHLDTHWNENLLLASPASLLLTLGGIRILRNRHRALAFSLVVCCFLLGMMLLDFLLSVVGMWPQDNDIFIYFSLPLMACLIVGLWWAKRSMDDFPIQIYFRQAKQMGKRRKSA